MQADKGRDQGHKTYFSNSGTPLLHREWAKLGLLGTSITFTKADHAKAQNCVNGINPRIALESKKPPAQFLNQ